MVSTGVLTAVALFLAILFEVRFRQLRNLQPQVVNAQNNQNFVNALANDALDYSKQHPAIDPILQAVGVKPLAPAPAHAAPARPPGK
jgi:hypothetical protein